MFVAAGWLWKTLRMAKPAVGISIGMGKWRRENPVSLSWLVRQVIAAGKTQQASTLRSVWRLTQTCLWVPRHLDYWLFDPQNKRVSALIMERVSVKFGDHRCVSFNISHGKTDKHINVTENPIHTTALSVGTQLNCEVIVFVVDSIINITNCNCSCNWNIANINSKCKL